MIAKWETLSKNAAQEKAEVWSNLPEEGFQSLLHSWKNHEVEDCPYQYLPLRDKLVNAYENAKATAKSENPAHFSIYQEDYRFAMQVYAILNEEGLSNRTASDDGVWRFLTMVVVPDIIYERWNDENDPRKINADRFYFATRRIWLKVLWWFVYLCWQGSAIETQKMISTNNSNEISQLVERAGTGGYRVDLYREIMKYYDTKISQDDRTKEHNLLSRVLQLNIARSQIIEPDLVPGGISEYVKSLFEYFGY